MEIDRRGSAEETGNTPQGMKKVPVPGGRDGDCALLLLDLNQQPFD